jgi:hypothetical protein
VNDMSRVTEGEMSDANDAIKGEAHA